MQREFEDWQRLLDLNLNTTFLACKHCLRLMRQHGYGRIVTVGSRGAIQPAAQLAAYSAAKAGVVALTQAIAQETKDLDITANVVSRLWQSLVTWQDRLTLWQNE